MTHKTQEAQAVKRRYPRLRLPKGMLVAWQFGGSRGVARVSTLGLGGLFIATREPAPVGALLKLIFDVPGGEVRARATVRNIKPAEGMAAGVFRRGPRPGVRAGPVLRTFVRSAKLARAAHWLSFCAYSGDIGGRQRTA